MKAEESKKKEKKVICSLMMNQMAIKKHISWDGMKQNGYIDLGNGINDDSLQVAADALVYLVAVDAWVLESPMWIFFVDCLSGNICFSGNVWFALKGSKMTTVPDLATN